MDEHINAIAALDKNIEYIVKFNYKTNEYKAIFGDFKLDFSNISNGLETNSIYTEMLDNYLIEAIKINRYYAWIYVIKTNSEKSIKDDEDFRNFIKKYNSRKVGIMYFHVLKNKKQFTEILSDYKNNTYKINKSDYYVIFTDISRTTFNRYFINIKNNITKNKLMIGSFSIWENNCENIKNLINKAKRYK